MALCDKSRRTEQGAVVCRRPKFPRRRARACPEHLRWVAVEPELSHVQRRQILGTSPRMTSWSDQTLLSTIIFLISAIALAGFSPLGQACVQFMIV